MSEGLKILEELSNKLSEWYSKCDCNCCQEFKEYEIRIDVALPELQQAIENAEKWNAYRILFEGGEKRIKEVIKKASLFDRLFERMVVEEMCKGNVKHPHCYTELCNKFEVGKDGICRISLPLNEEEKVEAIEKIKNLQIMVVLPYNNIVQNIQIAGAKYFISLKSGKRVVREK